MTNKKNSFIILSSLLSCSIFLVSCAKKSINIEYNGHIYINTILNDSVFGNFIYDTGCKEIILDTTFCNENNLKFNSIILF